MPLTKSDLIDQLSTLAKLPRGTAEQIVNTIFDSMVDALVREQRIEIRGFGSFEVRSYKAYTGRNPRTGEPVEVAPKKLPFFKVGKDLRERVDRGTGAIERDDGDDGDDDDQELDSDNGPSRASTLGNAGSALQGSGSHDAIDSPVSPVNGERQRGSESYNEDDWEPPVTD